MKYIVLISLFALCQVSCSNESEQHRSGEHPQSAVDESKDVDESKLLAEVAYIVKQNREQSFLDNAEAVLMSDAATEEEEIHLVKVLLRLPDKKSAYKVLGKFSLDHPNPFKKGPAVGKAAKEIEKLRKESFYSFEEFEMWLQKSPLNP